MPFTFSHPAIILPLRYLPKKWFSLTGLVIGSLTPDFEYFLRMRVESRYSHTLYGIFWFDLPLAIVISFIFHTIIKNQLFNNLPENIRSRLLIYNNFNWNNYFKQSFLIVLISIVIGISSHIFWDSFTHRHGYFVNHIYKLKGSISIFNIPIPILKIAQHLSTFIGAVIILITLLKLPKYSITKTVIDKSYWIALLTIIFIIITIRFLIGLNYREYGHIIVSVISAILLSLIITSFYFNLKVVRKN
jgi:hypothetical protein